MQTKPKTFYKAVTLNYLDFASGTIDYSVGNDVVHPNPGKFGKGEADGYLSVALEPTGCIGSEWPLRLLEVEVEESWQPHNVIEATKDYRNKHAVHRLKVVREIEAWNVFGPQGERVAELTDKANELWDAKESSEKLYTQLQKVSYYLSQNIYNTTYREKVRLEGLRESAYYAVPYTDLIDALRILVVADLLDMDNPVHVGLLEAAENGITMFEEIYDEYKNPPPSLREKIAAWLWF